MSIIYVCLKCKCEMELRYTVTYPILHYFYCSHCGNIIEESCGNLYATPCHNINI